MSKSFVKQLKAFHKTRAKGTSSMKLTPAGSDFKGKVGQGLATGESLLPGAGLSRQVINCKRAQNLIIQRSNSLDYLNEAPKKLGKPMKKLKLGVKKKQQQFEHVLEDDSVDLLSLQTA